MPGLRRGGKSGKKIASVKAKGLLAEEAEGARRPPGGFATTHWSMIAQAAESATPAGRAALEELCRIYWTPLYWFARRRGLAPADAEDLTQGFFADLLARDAVAQADEGRGRFRTFLLTSFENYRSYQRRHDRAVKRGGGRPVVSLEAMEAAERRYHDEPATAETPERIYERKWALSLIEVAVAAVRDDYAACGKGTWFDELRGALWGGGGRVSYAEIARRLGSTEGAVKVAVHRLRKHFGERFRAEVTKTVVDSAETDDEIRHLLTAVST